MRIRKVISDAAHNAPKNKLQECFDQNLTILLEDVEDGKPGSKTDLHSQLLFAAKHDLAIPNRALVVLLENEKIKKRLTEEQLADLEALYHIEAISYFEVTPSFSCLENQYICRPFHIENKRSKQLTFRAACEIYHKILLAIGREHLSRRHREYLLKDVFDFWEFMKGKKKSIQ